MIAKKRGACTPCTSPMNPPLFSNPRDLIALEFNFNFGFSERLVINVNKDLEKVFICFLGVFNFFNVISISVVQIISKFVNIFFIVIAFAGKFYDLFLSCLVSLSAKTVDKWSDKSVFIMADLKSLWLVIHYLVIMWSMVFAECLVICVGLFVKGIIL